MASYCFGRCDGHHKMVWAARVSQLTACGRFIAPCLPRSGLVLNARFEQDGPFVFEHACLAWLLPGHRVEAQKLPLSLRALAQLGKCKNPAAPAVKREAEEDWGR
jgi:hypothetical protein